MVRYQFGFIILYLVIQQRCHPGNVPSSVDFGRTGEHAERSAKLFLIRRFKHDIFPTFCLFYLFRHAVPVCQPPHHHLEQVGLHGERGLEFVQDVAFNRGVGRLVELKKGQK